MKWKKFKPTWKPKKPWYFWIFNKNISRYRVKGKEVEYEVGIGRRF